MGAFVYPFTRCGNPLAGGDGGCVSYGGHQLAVAARLDANNAEPVLPVVIGHALDKTSQNFLG